MSLRVLAAAGVSVACFLMTLTACHAASPAVTSRLAPDAAIQESPATTDTVVLARCRALTEIQRRRRGDWFHSRWLAQYDVLDVESGTWPEAELSFTYDEASPTPESGIMLMARVAFFRLGEPRRFWLDTRTQPATIVAHAAVSK